MTFETFATGTHWHRCHANHWFCHNQQIWNRSSTTLISILIRRLISNCIHSPWWRHQMETFSALLALCVWGIHRSPVISAHNGQWRGALMFFFICAWINGWINNREASDLGCHCAHYDVTVMQFWLCFPRNNSSRIWRNTCYMSRGIHLQMSFRPPDCNFDPRNI